MKIMLSGGGTLGPVTPLLGLVDAWRSKGDAVDVVWVGTVNGPEAALVQANDVRFISIASVKLPRYATPYWLIMPFMALYALIEAWNVLKAERPDVIVTAGGYVSVPLVLLGRLKGIKSWVHQQDIVPGLANKIMAKFAARVSVTFERTAPAFPEAKTTVTGNATRQGLGMGDREIAAKRFGLDPSRPTILVFGGGTGSAWVNRTMSAIADDLTQEWQVLHIAGEQKRETVQVASEHYVVEPIIRDGMDDAYAIADVVVCRAGLGTMTDLATVGKPAVVIPMPDSHQEMNAFFLYEHQAALILDQTETTPQVLYSAIKSILSDDDVKMRLCANLKLSFPKDGTAQIAEGVLEIANASASTWQGVETKDDAVFVDEVDVAVEEIDEAREEEAMVSIREQIARALNPEEVVLEEGSDDEDDGPVRVTKLDHDEE